MEKQEHAEGIIKTRKSLQNGI